MYLEAAIVADWKWGEGEGGGERDEGRGGGRGAPAEISFKTFLFDSGTKSTRVLFPMAPGAPRITASQ